MIFLLLTMYLARSSAIFTKTCEFKHAALLSPIFHMYAHIKMHVFNNLSLLYCLQLLISTLSARYATKTSTRLQQYLRNPFQAANIPPAGFEIRRQYLRNPFKANILPAGVEIRQKLISVNFLSKKKNN